MNYPVHSPTHKAAESTSRNALGISGRRSGDGWLDRWIETVEDLARLQQDHPMVDASLELRRDRQDRERQLGNPQRLTPTLHSQPRPCLGHGGRDEHFPAHQRKGLRRLLRHLRHPQPGAGERYLFAGSV